MRVRRPIVVVIAALVMWTAVSFWMLATISHTNCFIFRTTADPTLTQAEMDAETAAKCNHLHLPGDLLNQPIPVLGYVLIVGFGVAFTTRGKREGSADQ